MVSNSRPPGRPPASRSVAPRELARRALRRARDSDQVLVIVLTAVTIGIGSLATALGATVAPPDLIILPVLAGGLLLRLRSMRVLLFVAAVAIGYDLVTLGVQGVRLASLFTLTATGAVSLQLARIRDRLGMSSASSESILLELRDRLRRHGELPPLPGDWRADVALRSAGGGTFGGDFLVATRSAGGRQLELALVDVSGKGLGVGSRALLLSGALGGLLGAVTPDRFLAAANDYLYRQGWEEGFATAAYVVIDLQTGEYALRSAGHPPAAQFRAGSGRWELSHAHGPVLGVIADATFPPERGRLDRNDALLLYTDGMVEIPGRELATGIDRLLGEAERLVPYGFAGGADRLVTAAAPKAADDRGIVLVWRE